MKKYIVILLVALLAISCKSTTVILIPPGKYINPDGVIWSPANTDPNTTLTDIYSYSKKKKGYIPIVQLKKN